MIFICLSVGLRCHSESRVLFAGEESLLDPCILVSVGIPLFASEQHGRYARNDTTYIAMRCRPFGKTLAAPLLPVVSGLESSAEFS